MFATWMSPRPVPSWSMLEFRLNYLEVDVLTSADKPCAVVVSLLVVEVTTNRTRAALGAVATYSSVEVTCHDGQAVRLDRLERRVELLIKRVLVAVVRGLRGRVSSNQHQLRIGVKVCDKNPIRHAYMG